MTGAGDMTQISRCMLLLLLCICALQDLRRQEIYILFPAAGIFAGLVFAILSGSGWTDAASGIVIGAVLTAAGRLTEEGVGIGDGWVTAACGSFLGWLQTLTLLLTALLLMSAVSCCLLAAHRKKRSDRLAFVPFLLAAYVILQAGA